MQKGIEFIKKINFVEIMKGKKKKFKDMMAFEAQTKFNDFLNKK